MKSRLRGAFVDRMDQSERIATRYLNEQDFESVAFGGLVRRIYRELREQGQVGA